MAFGSISTPRRSRTALAYSVRLSRWSSADRPGFTWAAAARSSSLSSQVATRSYVALSGRRAPGGGIERLRSFTTTFSHVSPELNTCSVSALSSARLAVLTRSLWHVTQYVATSSRAGVAAVARVGAGGVDAGVPAWFADSVAEIVAINAIDLQAIISVNGFCRMRIGFPQIPSATDLRQLFRATPVLCLAGMAELRIRAVLQQNIGPCLVVQNAAETIAETRRGQPGCHACLADDVHVGALLNQQLEQPIPAAIAGTEQRILIERGDGLRVDTHVEQECDRLERPILVVDHFTDSSIETRRGEQRVGVGLRDEIRIRSRGQQDAHHLHIGSICGDNKRRRANRVVVSARPRTSESRWTRRRLKIWGCAVRQQCPDEPQLGFTIRNSADRIDEPVDRICQPVFPRARRPMKRSKPGIKDVRIRPVVQEEQRERHLASHGGDEQRRAAAEVRGSARAESTCACASGRTAASSSGASPRAGPPRSLPSTVSRIGL